MKVKIQKCSICGKDIKNDELKFFIKAYAKRKIRILDNESYKKEPEFKFKFCQACYFNIEKAVSDAIVLNSFASCANKVIQPEEENEKQPCCDDSMSCPKFLGVIQDCRDCEVLNR